MMGSDAFVASMAFPSTAQTRASAFDSAAAVASDGQLHVIQRAEKTYTGVVVDLSCSYGGISSRTYCVSGADRSAWSLFDALLVAFAAVFQLPYWTQRALESAQVVEGWSLTPAAAAGLSALPVEGRYLHMDGWIAPYVPFAPLTLYDSMVSPLALILLLIVALRVGWSWVNSVSAESVTAIRGVGLQVAQRTPRGDVVSRVIDVNSIDCLAIHEGFFRHQVVYFLAVVVRDAPKVEVLFAGTMPRLVTLRPVLRGLRQVLYGEPEHGCSLAEAEATER
jgi:hypothetical protein